MGFHDSWWNISMSSLMIIAASVFEVTCENRQPSKGKGKVRTLLHDCCRREYDGTTHLRIALTRQFSCWSRKNGWYNFVKVMASQNWRIFEKYIHIHLIWYRKAVCSVSVHFWCFISNLLNTFWISWNLKGVNIVKFFFYLFYWFLSLPVLVK